MHRRPGRRDRALPSGAGPEPSSCESRAAATTTSPARSGCKTCPEGERPILGAWYIESHFQEFDPTQVNERRNIAVTTQQPDDSGRLRHRMHCPKCRNAPVLRQESIDRMLGGIYEHGAAKVVRLPV